MNFFKKKPTLDAAADAVIKKRGELEAIEAERKALLAERLEAEDTGADTSGADKKLAENSRRLEVARAAVAAAQERLVVSAMSEAATSLSNLPGLVQEYRRLAPETITAGMRHAELAARNFECAGAGELAQRVRAALVDPATRVGADGVADDLAQFRGQGALQAAAELSKNPIPDLARMRQRISDLQNIPGDKPQAGGHYVERIWKRALGAAQRRAGIKYDGFEAWRRKQNARAGT